MIIKRFIGGSLESNCYIINNRNKNCCYIIDPGYEPDRIISYVKDCGLKAEGVILTHHHHDHVGGADKVSDRLECPVMMSFEDSIRYKGHVDKILNDGDVLELDGEKLVIRATPGHTKGSICIEAPQSRIVFTGDTIFDTDLGRTDLADGSEKEMALTCRNVIAVWPDAYTIYPGHDDSATMKMVRKYNEEFLQMLEAK